MEGMDPATRPHLVSTVHGIPVNAYSAVMTRGERDRGSDTVRDYVALRTTRGSIRVASRWIHRGIDPAEYPPGFPGRPPGGWQTVGRVSAASRTGKIITPPGRITRLKGHEDFLRLLGRLCAQDNHRTV